MPWNLIPSLTRLLTFNPPLPSTPTKVNIAIHFACIWPILWTSFAVLHKTTPFFGKKASKDGESSQGVNWATVAAGVYAAYYALMDNSIGRVGALMVLASYKTSGTWVHSGPNNVRKALAINALAWVGQIYGHLAHEGRAPALMSNLSQGVLMGPLFVLFEAAHSLGFKKEFFAEIRDIVGVNLLELKLGKGPATA